MTDRNIHILILEDNAADAELMKRELRKFGFNFAAECSANEAAFIRALDTFIPDIMLADYSLPGFDGLTAMDLARQRFPELPVIIVSGAIGEEVAIETMKAGANDYVLKQRLSRLGPVVERALKEAEHLVEKKRIEKALWDREKELRLIMDAGPTLISYVDAESRYVRVNKTFEQWFGVAPERVVGLHIWEVMGDAAWQSVKPYVGRALAGETVTYEQELEFRKGGARWIHATYTPDRDESGRIRGFTVHALDIGERKRAEEAIRRAKEEWERTFDTVPDLLAILDDQYRITRLNRAMADRLGMRPAQAIGRRCYEVVHGTSAPPEFCPHFLSCADREEHMVEVHEPRLGGDFLVSTTPLCDPQGRIIGSIHVARDITVRKRAEEKIRREKEFSDSLINSLPGVFYALDADGKMLRTNSEFSKVTGYTQDEIARMRGMDFFAGKEKELVEEKRKEGFTKGTVSMEAHFVSKSGDATPYYFTGARIDKDGVPILIGMGIDITQRKKAEEIMQRDKEHLAALVEHRTQELLATKEEAERSKRLAAVGTLAATVAHELRNPLSAIRMACANIERKNKNASLEKHLKNIDLKIDESDQIIDNLLFYSRLRMPRYEHVDMYRILEDVIAQARGRIENRRIVKDYAMLKSLAVEADPLQMKELFNNIMNNACDAILSGPAGRVSVRARASEADNIFTVWLKDSGEGIKKEDMDKLFEPFFSTKAKGTGLGLAVARQIVSLHGGKITIESGKKSGTAVIVTLPIKRDTSPGAPSNHAGTIATAFD